MAFNPDIILQRRRASTHSKFNIKYACECECARGASMRERAREERPNTAIKTKYQQNMATLLCVRD